MCVERAEIKIRRDVSQRLEGLAAGFQLVLSCRGIVMRTHQPYGMNATISVVDIHVSGDNTRDV